MSSYAAAVRPDGDATLLRVRLVPRASRTAVAGMTGEAVRLRVAAPPVEGRANAAALDHLAGLLGVRARDLAVVAGHRARDKVIRVPGLPPAEVARRLAG